MRTIFFTFILMLSLVETEVTYSAMIPSHYIDATVSIGTTNQDSSINWIGSGFIAAKLDRILPSGKGSYKLFLVTNRHVIAEANNLIVRMNPKDKKPSKDYAFPSITEKGNLWVFHPNNQIDIAVHYIDPNVLMKDNIINAQFGDDGDFIDISEMRRREISEGDFIYILGFPLGIVDKERQYVIAKSGVIARIRDIYDKNKGEFLIDAKIYPGNSGGPVVIKPEMNTLQGSKSVDSAGLIGIIKAYIPYQDVAVSIQTKKPRIIFEENSGLAVVIPVDYVSETIQEFYKKYNLEYAKNPKPK